MLDEGLIFEELHSEALPKGMRLWGALMAVTRG